MGGKKAGAGHLASRVKKIMQKDEDVGKIAQATPVLICRAMELLLKKVCERTFEVASARQAKTINTSHVKHCVMSEEMLDFLKETVASAPDLAPEEAQPTKAAPKRRRAAAAADDSDGSPAEKPKRTRAPRASKKKEEGSQDGDTPAPTPKRRGRKKAQPEDAQGGASAGDTAGEEVHQGALQAMHSDEFVDPGESAYEQQQQQPQQLLDMGTAAADLDAQMAAVAAAAAAASAPGPAPSAAQQAAADSKPASKLSLRSKHPLSLKASKKLAGAAGADEAQQQQHAPAELKAEEVNEELGEQQGPAAEQLPPMLPLAAFGPTNGADLPQEDYDDDYDT